MPIADILAFVLSAIGVLLLIPVGLLFVEIVASLGPLRAAPMPSSRRPRIAVLVPAHDEALSIAATLKSIRSELTEGDRLLVVADNCSDDTAQLARAAGAEVIERQDPARRGKGFALDFGVRHFAADPPDVVIVNDADCTPEAGAYTRIAVTAHRQQRPVQACYEMRQPSGASSLYLKFAIFAIRVKNRARPLGCHRLGLASQLMGTGMAFPWDLIGKANLATSEIVEDLAYGLEFARNGHAPVFCPSAVVTSTFPMSQEGQSTQRARWETGHLNVIAHSVPSLLTDAIRRGNFLLLGSVLDAAVPPLAFLALLIAVFGFLAVLTALLAGSMIPLLIALAAGPIFLLTVILAWWRVGREAIAFSELACAPIYLLSKLALYGRVLAGRKVGWIRSRRDAL